MKKIISVCLCICLMSGCDKSLSHGRPANAVAEDKGSEGVPTQSLTSDTPNASASEPSNTPIPIPEPSKSALPSDTTDTGSSVGKYVGYAVAFILSIIVVCYGGYKLLYRFADPKPIFINKLDTLEEKDITEGYKECYFSGNFGLHCSYFFDRATFEYIDEIPVYATVHRFVPECECEVEIGLYFYKPNPSKLKPLLRKIFGIKLPED
ncbi:hypothetical protein [Candidatus Endomicrobiellum agilis]|uniref:hypothetical protein n=1 Tax=Candidatus Endomicrobiellum agilis TaxID=3238957 RepID=UPI003576CFA5|nr:hypothetical protein [Endomicrobium sp.]